LSEYVSEKMAVSKKKLIFLYIVVNSINTMPDTSLLKTLQNVGFDEKEAAAYLALLELGGGTVSEIAEHAGLKRPIVYHVMDRLKEKGFAIDPPGDGVMRFEPVDPLKILQTTRTAVEDLKFMLPLMRALQDKGPNKPKLEYFEGKEAVVSVYRQFDYAKNARFLTSMSRLYQLIPEEVEAWVKRFERGMFPKLGRHLIPDTKQDRDWAKKAVAAGQEVRFLPKNMDTEMDFAIIDDMLGITSFDPLFMVLIHSERIAKSAAQLFDLAWRQGHTS
jgi:sugar-specific transcriptional regulator TrmB